MKRAAVNDQMSNQNQQVATEKLKMLPKVSGFLSKLLIFYSSHNLVARRTFLHEQLIDNEILHVMRMWLEPLPDGTMPTLNVRKLLLESLRKVCE